MIYVPTGLKGTVPDVSAVLDTAKMIASKNAERGTLVCVESTVALGTCQQAAKLLQGNFLVRVPHRYWRGDPIKRGVKQEGVIGALNQDSMRSALGFYRKVGIPLTQVSTLDGAEMTKLVENSFRFVQIAFTEEVSLLCKSFRVDWDLVRSAANTKWNIEIAEARFGMEGCLSKDIRYLLSASSARRGAIEGAVDIDRVYEEVKGKKQLSRLQTEKTLSEV